MTETGWMCKMFWWGKAVKYFSFALMYLIFSPFIFALYVLFLMWYSLLSFITFYFSAYKSLNLHSSLLSSCIVLVFFLYRNLLTNFLYFIDYCSNIFLLISPFPAWTLVWPASLGIKLDAAFFVWQVIMFLSKSDEETTSNRKLAKELVDKWVI